MTENKKILLDLIKTALHADVKIDIPTNVNKQYVHDEVM